MNAVSTLGVPFPMVRNNNTVQLQAGDSASGMGIVYQGYLSNAYQNYDGTPETMLELIGLGARLQALVPASPTSYPGPADVATIMSGLANRMGLAFENSGVQVQVQLSSPYFAGTLLQQAKKCAEAANIELLIDTGEDPPTLAIWPKTGTRGRSNSSDLRGVRDDRLSGIFFEWYEVHDIVQPQYSDRRKYTDAVQHWNGGTLLKPRRADA